ncbi:MAG: hypothetical protein IJ229_05835, partial [Clostridia bacterium]|nr:hypothetical protein [Clostridia bacterium]
ISLPPIRGKKSWEGSIAMLAFSFLSGIALLCGYYRFPLSDILLPTLIAALLGTVTEAVSASEWDTVTVPLAVGLILLLAGI